MVTVLPNGAMPGPFSFGSDLQGRTSGVGPGLNFRGEDMRKGQKRTTGCALAPFRVVRWQTLPGLPSRRTRTAVADDPRLSIETFRSLPGFDNSTRTTRIGGKGYDIPSCKPV